MKNNKSEKGKRIVSQEQFNELIGIILIFLGIFMLITLVTYDPERDIQNIVGKAGKVIASSLIWFIGWSTYLIPAILIYLGVYKFFKRAIKKFWLQLVSFLITLISVSSLLGIYYKVWSHPEYYNRVGLLGKFISQKFFEIFGILGAYLVIILLIIVSVIISTEIVFSKILMKLRDFWIQRRETSKEKKLIKDKRKQEDKIKEREKFRERLAKKQEKFKKETKPDQIKVSGSKKDIKEPPARKNVQEKKEKPIKITFTPPGSQKNYKLPGLNIYEIPQKAQSRELTNILKANGELLLECLRDFGVTARIENIVKGPVISRFEIKLAPGIKVSSITNLADDIAYAIKATRIRVIAPIPGKTAVGIEIPNPEPQIVYFKELITSSEYLAS
ncbi:DNA translocase FtsK 4TM domain-containing protein, partial [Candidatus Dependentiae bacterium]|nr:DNA translocase FtsK 4TM domain-containing protein [Candidatus Dependentiae bacterium]